MCVRVQIAELSARRDKLSAEGGLGFYRDRLVATEKKRSAIQEKLNEVEEERKENEAELSRINKEIQQATTLHHSALDLSHFFVAKK